MSKPRPLIEVEGAKRLRRTLREAGDDLEDLKTAHAAAAKIAAEAAAALAPRRSGALAASVRSSGQKTAGVIRAGKKRIPYAGVIHWGWPRRGIPARPFLTEGAQRTEPLWIPIYEKAIEHALDQIKGK